MSTVISTDREEAAAGGQPPPTSSPATQGGLSGWLASWRVALRMARRDVRRHRGRSLVVLLMVGLPSMLIVAGLVLSASAMVEGAERIPTALGSAQAELSTPAPNPVSQGADPLGGNQSSGDEPAAEVPGYDPEGTPFDNAEAISALVGAPVVPYAQTETRVAVGDRTKGLATLAVSRPDALGEKVRLVDGRWPSAPGEVLVSPTAVRDGVPSSGPLSLADAKGELEVVGTAMAFGDYGQSYALLTTTALDATDAVGGWYVLGDDPVTWPEVRELNGHGIAVTSAEVLRNPPSAQELPADIAEMESFGQARQSLAVVTVGAVALIFTTLLIGPAFAVSAARQRRTLALAAANGATRGQLRRTVLAQALVLGGLSAVLAGALGILAAWGLHRYAEPREWLPPGPFDIPWGQVAAVAAVAVLSSVVAALLPASRLGRLDIVGVMRGQQDVAPPSRAALVAGLVLAALGSVGVLAGARRTGTETLIVGAAVALVLGVLLTVPTILHLLGRAGGRLPLSLRLAARDLARHRARSAPTVAAVLAGTAMLTIGLVGATSDDEQRAREYVPSTIQGEAVITGTRDVVSEDAVGRYRAALPALTFTPSSRVGSILEEDPSAPVPFVTVVPEGCTPVQTVHDTEWEQQMQEPATGAAEADVPASSPCQVISEFSYPMRPITVMPAAEIVRRLGLQGEEARQVEAGAGVVLGLPTDTGVVTDGAVRLVEGTMAGDPYAGGITLTDTTESTVPVVVRDFDRESSPAARQAGLLVPADVAERQGWPLVNDAVLVHADGRAVTDAEGERLATLVGADGYAHVERGYVNELGIVTAVLLGIFTTLLLVVTLTSTALSLAEQERDQATLAAVGASRRTRRLMAGGQALVLALVGVLLGIAVGMVPGIAITYPLTAMSWDPMTGEQTLGDPILVIPWAALLVMAVVVPLVAGLLASLTVRRDPTATRRTT